MSVQLAILGFLQECNYHGYELKKTIERKMGAWTDIKFGSIYHALGNLERDGFVRKVRSTRAKGKPARSVFAITDKGKAEFKRLLSENITHVARLVMKEDVGVYFGGLLDENRYAEVLGKRVELLKMVYRELVRHRSKMEFYPEEDKVLAYRLITRHLKHIKVEIDWFKLLKEDIEKCGMAPRAHPAEKAATIVRHPPQFEKHF